MDIVWIIKRHCKILGIENSLDKCSSVPWRDNIKIGTVIIKEVSKIRKWQYFIQLKNQYFWIVLRKGYVSKKKVIKHWKDLRQGFNVKITKMVSNIFIMTLRINKEWILTSRNVYKDTEATRLST